MQSKSWTHVFIIVSMLSIVGIGVLNYIVDPYSVTQHNILNIPIKLVSDDRSEKIVKITNSEKYDGVLLGSSRVYGMNPLMMSRYTGGSVYNLGVGTAQIEDHLGFLLYLEKLGKFPKNIVLGLDYYSFNKGLETNKYFVRNEKLNFINSGSSHIGYLSNFISIDVLGASIKTLKTYLGMKKREARFDVYGASGNVSNVFSYYPESGEEIRDIYAIAKKRGDSDFIMHPTFSEVSNSRIGYLKRLVLLSEQHQANLKVFVTPLYGKLLDDIYADDAAYKGLIDFKNELTKTTDFYDFLTYNDITKSPLCFDDPSHMEVFTGNLVLARLFNDENVDIPEGFGDFIEKGSFSR